MINLADAHFFVVVYDRGDGRLEVSPHPHLTLEEAEGFAQGKKDGGETIVEWTRGHHPQFRTHHPRGKPP